MNRIWMSGLIPLALVAALPARAQDVPSPRPAPSPADIDLMVRTNDEAGVVLPALEKLNPKKGGAPDHPGAMKILLDAANRNNRLAQLMLTYVYMGVWGDPRDPAQQLKWNVALAGDPAPNSPWRTRAALDAGTAYTAGRGTPVDMVQSARWLKVAADGGNVTAMTLYAIQLDGGEGVAKNVAEAIHWLTLAIDKGDADAMALMGAFYDAGNGVSKDPVKALALYEQAAAKGQRIAQFQAAVHYLRDRADPAKLAKGLAYVRQSAAASYAPAMGALGAMYWEGIGVDKDQAVAVDWMRKAAAGGDTVSMLGFILVARESNCTLISCDEAQDWIVKAGEAGDPEGLFLTGDMYEKGVGKLAKDPTKAIDCYRKAAAKGSDKARAALVRLGVAP